MITQWTVKDTKTGEFERYVIKQKSCIIFQTSSRYEQGQNKLPITLFY